MDRSSSEERDQGGFPFVETASGNLKIVPQQVVYESKQLSVVAANPRRTRVNIKAGGSGNRIGISEKCHPKLRAGSDDVTVLRLWQNRNLQNSKQMRSEEVGDVDAEWHGDSKQNRAQVTKLNEELSLAKLGFSQNVPVDWRLNRLPEKSDLYELLEIRINNFINPDVLVRIGNHEYHCHLLVLQCYSGFFLDKPKGRLEISERHVTKAAFSYIYEWMLHKGGESYRMLRRDNVLEIFMGAQYLQVRELVEQCWALIDNEDLFNEDKAFLLYLDARAAANKAVMELMVPRVQRFFLTLVASRDFVELSLQEVVLFLSSSFVCVRAEMEVFMAAVRWLLYDWQRRHEHVEEVMACVRFGLFEPKDLVDIQRNPEHREFRLVTSDPRVGRMIEDGLAYAIVHYWNADKGGHDHDRHGDGEDDRERGLHSLGLRPPVQRNWAGGGGGGKCAVKTYEAFLNELHKYRQMQALTNKAAGKERSGDSRQAERVAVTSTTTDDDDGDMILPRCK